MKSRAPRTAAALGAALSLIAAGAAAQQQDVGHKFPGTLGLDAGAQPRPGIYVNSRLLVYGADELRDRRGAVVPVPLELDIAAAAVGLGGVFELPLLGIHYGISVGIPLVHIQATSERPEQAIDLFGLGDLFYQPIRLGWRLPYLDLVVGYGFYAPTGRYVPGARGNIGRGQWTHELVAGTAVYFDSARSFRFSALASYDVHQKKHGVELTRGALFQVQGGLGKTFADIVDAGVAGAALWQVSDDRGSMVPEALRGSRVQVYAVGPELGVIIAPLRLRVSARFEVEFDAHATVRGQILSAGLGWKLW